MRKEREKTNKILEELATEGSLNLNQVMKLIGEDKEDAKELVKEMDKKGMIENQQGEFTISEKGHRRYNNFKTGRSKSDTDNRRLDTF